MQALCDGQVPFLVGRAQRQSMVSEAISTPSASRRSTNRRVISSFRDCDRSQSIELSLQSLVLDWGEQEKVLQFECLTYSWAKPRSIDGALRPQVRLLGVESLVEVDEPGLPIRERFPNLNSFNA